MRRAAVQPATAVALAADASASAQVAPRTRRSRRLAHQNPAAVLGEVNNVPPAPPPTVSGHEDPVAALDGPAALSEDQALRLAIERSLVASSAPPPPSAVDDTGVTSESSAFAAGAEVVVTRSDTEVVPATDDENDFETVNRKRPPSKKQASKKKAMRAATKKLFVPKSRIFWTKDPKTGHISIFCLCVFCAMRRSSVIYVHKPFDGEILFPRVQARWCEAGGWTRNYPRQTNKSHSRSKRYLA